MSTECKISTGSLSLISEKRTPLRENVMNNVYLESVTLLFNSYFCDSRFWIGKCIKIFYILTKDKMPVEKFPQSYWNKN